MNVSRFVVTAFVLASAIATADPLQLVVAAPGSPGTTEDAQPALNAFAAALSAKSGQTIAAIYEPTDPGGVAQIGRSGLAIVSLPFFLAHEKELGLHARLQIVQEGRPAFEHWALAVQRGRVRTADDLRGFTIVSGAAFAPVFVRAVAQALGPLPEVRLQQSVAVLSALRRASDGEQIAVLLDGTQTDALPKLPFAGKLDVVARSPAWPAGLVVTVDARVPEATWRRIEPALLGLVSDRTGAAALGGMHVSKFIPLDTRVLASAREAYARAQREPQPPQQVQR